MQQDVNSTKNNKNNSSCNKRIELRSSILKLIAESELTIKEACQLTEEIRMNLRENFYSLPCKRISEEIQRPRRW